MFTDSHQRDASLVRVQEQEWGLLAKQVKNMAEQDWKRSLDMAIQIGGILQTLHDKIVAAGSSWKAYGKHLPFSIKTADSYRRLWQNRDLATKAKSIRDALESIKRSAASLGTSEGDNEAGTTEEVPWVKSLDALYKRAMNIQKQMALLLDVSDDDLVKTFGAIGKGLEKAKELAHRPHRPAESPGAAKCRFCKMDGFWATTQTGKRMFVTTGGGQFELVENRLTKASSPDWDTPSYSRHFCKEQAAARATK